MLRRDHSGGRRTGAPWNGTLHNQCNLYILDFKFAKKLPAELFCPAVSQGAIAVTCLRANMRVRSLLLPINHWPTVTSCNAERALLRRLGGGCKVPVGVLSAVRSGLSSENFGTELHLKAQVCSLDGAEAMDCELMAALGPNPLSSDESQTLSKALGERLAEELLKKGADVVIESIIN